ncbi:translation initiation factor eIF3 subunit g [Diaporthe eres]|uniref:Translation initiation factor eIF3 subunit g n=1 Tax=Diaporthe eres TaxID=83184 RepID=A0ABR1PIR6_DIAER
MDFDTASPTSSSSATSSEPRTTISRRQRPPDIDITAAMENRIPLRATKEARSSKRESRLGFRSIFARHRGSGEADEIKAARNVARAGKRESMTVDKDGSPPYALRPTAVQSETHLAPVSADGPFLRPRTSTIKSPTFMAPRSPLGPTTKRRGSLATWDPVPLFQAYPQAVRTATLPACVQADSLLRAHQKRELINNSNINHPDLGDQKALFVDMARKKHRRNSSSVKLDWTTKLYVLVTSGYLLQYSGDGTHDRLPEKVIQLCKDSAAFASDIIPGKHWVLQVSSVFEDGAVVSQDTRSLFGKFGMREKEKRLASDILMVFENVDDMEDWMSFLRREIESLGGKRPVTETGAPKEPVEHTQLKSQPSQRALVVRDPYKFVPAVTSPESRWDASVAFDEPELHLDATLTELLPDRSFDDNSTTNSFVSQDGRQLDGLRDSSNRYSFTSAARTIVTSDSSPSNSPIRDSFGSLISNSDEPTPLAEETEIRRRPNAAEIEDRRQSYRTSNMVHDISAGQPPHKAHSSLSSIQEPPNFSLPYSGTRRRSATQDSVHVHNAHGAPGRPPRRMRRPPPSALGLSRPLSIVADTPSPSKLSPPPRSPLKTDDSTGIPERPNSPSMFAGWSAGNAKPEYDLSSRASSRGSMRTSYQVSVHNSPRKYASMHTLRPTDDSVWGGETPKFDLPIHAAFSGSSLRDRAEEAAEIPRSMSSMDTYETSGRSRSPIIRAAAAQKRASMCSLPSVKASPRHRSVSMFPTTSRHRAPAQSSHRDELTPGGRATSPSPHRGPRRGSAMTIPGHGQKQSGSSSPRSSNKLNNRRSLPQMPHAHAQSSPLLPPPAPPPTKALPPIPQARKRRSSSIPPRMGMRTPATLVGGDI